MMHAEELHWPGEPPMHGRVVRREFRDDDLALPQGTRGQLTRGALPTQVSHLGGRRLKRPYGLLTSVIRKSRTCASHQAMDDGTHSL